MSYAAANKRQLHMGHQAGYTLLGISFHFSQEYYSIVSSPSPGLKPVTICMSPICSRFM